MAQELAATELDSLVSPAALAFAAENQADEYLLAVIELTQRIFPSARQVHLTLEEDPVIRTALSCILRALLKRSRGR